MCSNYLCRQRFQGHHPRVDNTHGSWNAAKNFIDMLLTTAVQGTLHNLQIVAKRKPAFKRGQTCPFTSLMQGRKPRLQNE